MKQGLAYVDFEDEESLATALAKRDQKLYLRGQEVSIARSNPTRERGWGRGFGAGRGTTGLYWFMLGAWLRVFDILHGHMLLDAVVESVCMLFWICCFVLCFQSSRNNTCGGSCFCVQFQVDFGHLWGYLSMISQDSLPLISLSVAHRGWAPGRPRKQWGKRW